MRSCLFAKSKAAINTAQKARSINPERKRKDRVERLRRAKINENQRNDITMTEEEMKAFAEEQALKVQDRISERVKAENLDPNVNYILFGLYLCDDKIKIMDKKFIEDLKRYIDIMHEEYTSWADDLRKGMISGEKPEE